MPAVETNKRTVLRALIDERGLRYNFVADKIGTNPSNLTRLMNGERSLPASELLALERLLGVDAAVFFDGRDLLLVTDVPTSAPSGVSGETPTSAPPAPSPVDAISNGKVPASAG